jgi:hypothetical protein
LTAQWRKPFAAVSACSFTALAVVLLLALSASLGRTQFRASIQGAVTDQSGAVVSGATLT